MKIKKWLLRRLAVRKNVHFDKSLHVGPGSVVWAPTQLRIGRDCYIGKYATIEVDGSIGDGTLIANTVGVVGRDDHDINAIGVPISRADWVGDHARLSSPVHIGADVWIGFGAVVLSGITIGSSSIVAAGAVVTSDVPPNSIVVGSPARVVRERFSQQGLEEHWRRMRSLGYSIPESR